MTDQSISSLLSPSSAIKSPSNHCCNHMLYHWGKVIVTCGLVYYKHIIAMKQHCMRGNWYALLTWYGSVQIMGLVWSFRAESSVPTMVDQKTTSSTRVESTSIPTTTHPTEEETSIPTTIQELITNPTEESTTQPTTSQEPSTQPTTLPPLKKYLGKGLVILNLSLSCL